MNTSVKSQLQFVPYNSALDPGFWHQLSQKKLDVYGLDEELKAITGFYTNGDADSLPSRVNLDFTAFNKNASIPPRCYCCNGFIKNTNTVDGFKSCDKKQLLQQQADQIWSDITSGKAIEDPSLLSKLLLLTFADLKKYHYYYWFAFPALCYPCHVDTITTPSQIDEVFTEKQIAGLLASFDEVCLPKQIGYFLVSEDVDDTLRVLHLSQFDQLHNSGKKIMLGFCDPCTLKTNPGWPLRNFLALAANQWSSKLGDEITVICLRDRFKDGKRNVSHSILLKLRFVDAQSVTECPKCVGWEKNERQKLGPRMVNLSANMDPIRLAESAVDLNLKLMRWRLLPELNLEKISTTRCLLLGAGTLGCNVARCLLGWGVRTVTLVDNATISYSNPVRQSLFVFEDSLHGGKPKAETAAAALCKIFPGVKARGICLSIAMPGHSVSDSIKDQVQKDVRQLESLIDDHDVIFLLMDTRESRWLPTVIGAAKQKIVISAALGFDTYLVVRHGVKKRQLTDSSSTDTSIPSVIPGDKLGCYFCNDVVAPGDCAKSRTSNVVDIVNGYAAADTSAKDEHLTKDFSAPLGLVPHQANSWFLVKISQSDAIKFSIRQMYSMLTAPRKEQFTIIEAYEKDGFDFLLSAFNKPKYLEDLTGLTKLHEETMDEEIWGFTDDEDD
ncbi:hypothetical protein LSH36_77g03008 [Paralvinella palmiformis]|uniref:Ubiquitin-like modifier-activating enzyme ATG7 n=1 Tax=Paralvinella palmiformis TaxID=53620 RepID=A0AAD9NDU8_9ANNE|nr:hypothetical protein LSH36_77g03008 [Paralvinella palmiformis]